MRSAAIRGRAGGSGLQGLAIPRPGPRSTPLGSSGRGEIAAVGRAPDQLGADFGEGVSLLFLHQRRPMIRSRGWRQLNQGRILAQADAAKPLARRLKVAGPGSLAAFSTSHPSADLALISFTRTFSLSFLHHGPCAAPSLDHGRARERRCVRVGRGAGSTESTGRTWSTSRLYTGGGTKPACGWITTAPLPARDSAGRLWPRSRRHSPRPRRQPPPVVLRSAQLAPTVTRCESRQHLSLQT